MWKKLRILILLLILLVVALNAYRDQNQDWSKPIIVSLHPVNADGQGTTQQYIQQLTPKN
jgi:putative cell wall-binding protein